MKHLHLAKFPFWSLISAMLFLTSDASLLPAADDQPEWKIGLVGAIVTPNEPVRMAGYGSQERKQLSQGIASELRARAMAIEDRDGNKALLITTDVIGLTAHVSEPLYKRITART